MQRLKFQRDKLLSSFAFNVNLHGYIQECDFCRATPARQAGGVLRTCTRTGIGRRMTCLHGEALYCNGNSLIPGKCSYRNSSTDAQPWFVVPQTIV